MQVNLYKMKSFFTLAIFLFSYIFSASGQSNVLPSFGIIPAPELVNMQPTKGPSLNRIRVFLPLEVRNPFLESLIQTTPGIEISASLDQSDVDWKRDNKLSSEAYLIKVTKKKILIKAGSSAGFQHAVISLIQMLTHHGLPLPQGIIEDRPTFAYRGMHLDVGRYFFSVEDVKKYLDYMAYYKYNHFHWHLTEDQGWRIEIKKYPRLQEVAAWRKETLVGHYNDQPQTFDGKKYGGYYSQEEVREIVRYAAERNITVVPEIEMPGHALAAIAAYPELGCGSGPYEVGTKWGIYDDVFCPNETTFAFLEDVIDEIVPLFPGKYIHIGGDECPKTAWKNSPFCQELMKKEGLKDEHALQSYFITRMEKYINAKGKQIIGWDEILEGGLAPNATVMSWRGIEGGVAAANENHEVIMTPTSFCYFDYYQSESPDEPLAIGGYLPMDQVYHWNPVPESLPVDKQKYIIGGQANVWTEYIPDYSKIEYMVYARAMAMSEVLWSKKKDYASFLPRFVSHQQLWKAKGANVANHIYDLKPVIKAGDGKPVRISFSVPQGASIAHSINGREDKALASGEEVRIEHSGNHIFTTMHSKGSGRPLELLFDLHYGTGADISINPGPSPKYSGNGPGSIINGVKGTIEKYGGTEWLGFEGTDPVITLDFKKDLNFNYIETLFFKAEGQWIYLPREIEVSMSDDGVNYKRIAGIKNIGTHDKIADVRFTPHQAHGRYMRFTIKNYGVIPEGKQGAGHRAWLFMDEIIIY